MQAVLIFLRIVSAFFSTMDHRYYSEWSIHNLLWYGICFFK